MKKLLLALGFGGLIYGAYKYYLLQSDILYYSTYKIANLRGLEKSMNNVKIEGTISVENKSSLDFILKSYDLAIFLNNKNRIGQIRNSNVDTLIKANETSYVTFNFDFNPSEFNLIDNLLEVLDTWKSSLITFKGDATIKKGIVNVAIPLNLTYRISDFV